MNDPAPSVVAAVALAIGSVLTAPGLVATTPAPPVSEARIVLPAQGGRIGDRILVELAGWPTGTVQLEVCGNEARRGALDCAVAAAVHVWLPGTGRATTQLTLVAPPTPCPCVVRAAMVTGATVATAPLALAGTAAVDSAASEPADPDAAAAAAGGSAGAVPPGPLRITHLEVVGALDPARRSALFALPSRLVVRVWIRNEGTTALACSIRLLAGPADRVNTIVAAPDLGILAAGETRGYLLRVPLDAPAVGRYAVHGEVAAERVTDQPGRIDLSSQYVGNAGSGATFVAETAVYPWGLPAVLGVLLVLPGVGRGLRRLVRRGSVRPRPPAVEERDKPSRGPG